MNIPVKVDNEWKTTTSGFVKVNGAWKKVTSGFVKVDGAWKKMAGAEKLAATPTVTGTLTYNNKTQSPTFNYDSAAIVLGGTTSAKNAGTYTATFKLRPGYKWADGSTGDKTINWSIGKANCVITPVKTSVTIEANETDFTLGFTGNIAGPTSIYFIVNTSNSAVATASGLTAQQPIINIAKTGAGSCTITVQQKESDNYLASNVVSIAVTCEVKLLNDYTWDEIREISDSGNAADYFKPGDTKTITINGKVGNTTFNNLSIDCFILGINHNADKEGTNRIHFGIGKNGDKLIGLADEKYFSSVSTTGYFSMNSSNINTGGWQYCQLRNMVLQGTGTPSSPAANTMLAALPSDLRTVMKSVTKYTNNTGDGSDSVSSAVTATTDYLFILADFEVYGGSPYPSNDYEAAQQEQYDYFKNGNSTCVYRYNNTSTKVLSWLRTPDGKLYFDCTNTVEDEGSALGDPYYSLAILPCFCV